MSNHFTGILFIQRIFTEYLLGGRNYSFVQQILSASCVPRTILGPGDIAVNKMDKMAFPQGVYISANLTL